MRRSLLPLAVVLCLATSALADAALWEQVCREFGVDHRQVQRPEIVVVSRNHPAVKGCHAVIFPYQGLIYTTTLDPRVIAHEYAHAVMFSNAYQEPRALAVEVKLFGSAYD
jgi:hypothetical protein